LIAILINRLRSNKLFKNIFNLSILQVISALLSLVLIPLLARILEPTIFGLIMFIHLITSYFIWFSEWGFSQGGTQKIASVRSNFSELSKIFNQIYSAQIVLVFLAILPLLLILIYFQAEYQYEFFLIPIIVIYFILSSLFPIWFFNGIERVTFAVIVQIYPKISALICVIFFIEQPGDFKYYFLSLILGLIIGIFQCLYSIFKVHHINFDYSNPLIQIKNNFNYFLSSFSKTMGSNIVPLFLGLLTSIELFGFYSLADKIKGAVLTILNPVYQSVFPRMCHIINEKSYYKYFKKYSLFIMIIVLFMSFFILFFIEPIINFFVGQNYQLSSTLIKLMIPAIILNSIVSIMYYFVLIPYDLSKSIMKVGLFQFLIVLTISYPLVNVLEIYGAITILTVSELLFLICYLFIAFKYKLLKN